MQRCCVLYVDIYLNAVKGWKINVSVYDCLECFCTYALVLMFWQYQQCQIQGHAFPLAVETAQEFAIP